VEARVGTASVLLESIVIAVSSNHETDRARELGRNKDRNLAIEYRWTEGRTERSIERPNASCGTQTRAATAGGVIPR